MMIVTVNFRRGTQKSGQGDMYFSGTTQVGKEKLREIVYGTTGRAIQAYLGLY